jgi:hypothetical protein
VLPAAWLQTQVTNIYSGGVQMKTKVAAMNPVTGKLEEKQVAWFKTSFSRLAVLFWCLLRRCQPHRCVRRHICLANDDSYLGKETNPWAIRCECLVFVATEADRACGVIRCAVHSLLRYWLKSVYVPVDRKFSVVNSVIHFSNKKLSTYFKDSVRLSLFPGESDRVKYIRPDTT